MPVSRNRHPHRRPHTSSINGLGLIGQSRHLASDYGPEAAKVAPSLSETVEGFLRVRESFLDGLASLARRRRLDIREVTALMVDAESALDRLLMALMTGHAKS